MWLGACRLAAACSLLLAREALRSESRSVLAAATDAGLPTFSTRTTISMRMQQHKQYAYSILYAPKHAPPIKLHDHMIFHHSSLMPISPTSLAHISIEEAPQALASAPSSPRAILHKQGCE